jgi:hypothetical protein
VILDSDYDFSSASDFVIETWFRPGEQHGNPPFHAALFGGNNSGDNILIQWTTGNVFRFYINGSNTWSTTPNASLTTNTWYHLAFVKSGTSVYVYLNGNRIGSGTRAATVNAFGYWQLANLTNHPINDGLMRSLQDFRVYLGTNKGYTGSTITVPDSIIEKV